MGSGAQKGPREAQGRTRAEGQGGGRAQGSPGGKQGGNAQEGLSRWHATSESIHRMCADIPLRTKSLLRMDHSGLESTSKQMLTENENICKLLNVAIYVRHQITLQ